MGASCSMYAACSWFLIGVCRKQLILVVEPRRGLLSARSSGGGNVAERKDARRRRVFIISYPTQARSCVRAAEQQILSHSTATFVKCALPPHSVT
eukprot:6176962-Pleurochrysis_carterae.AAC.3